MEWWVVEVVIILAGLLPDPSLSVSVTGICLNVMSLVYMLSFGLSGESTARRLQQTRLVRHIQPDLR